MNKFLQEQIDGLLDELGAEYAKEGHPWEEYRVFIPVYNGNPKIGLPYVILVKDGDARISTGKESMEYHYFLYPNEEE